MKNETEMPDEIWVTGMPFFEEDKTTFITYTHCRGATSTKYTRADRQAPQVDVEALISFCCEEFAEMSHDDTAIENVVKYMLENHAQGHISTNSPEIPDGYALVPIDPPLCDMVFECPYKLTDLSTEKSPLFVLEKKLSFDVDRQGESGHEIYKFYDRDQAIMRMRQMWFADYHKAMIAAAPTPPKTGDE